MKFFRCCITDLDNDFNEKVLVIIRGDALAKHKLGEIISELEKQFSILALKSVCFNEVTVRRLYPGILREGLIEYMTTGFHIALVIEGENAIHRMMQLKGNAPSTDDENTLRKKFGTNDLISCVHCSDTVAAARREIALFFKKSEIFSKIPSIDDYLEATQTNGVLK